VAELKNLTAILLKEFKSDFRNPYVLGGAGLFLLSTLFVCYITVKRINTPSIWVALFGSSCFSQVSMLSQKAL
jgi:hypothetical protein